MWVRDKANFASRHLIFGIIGLYSLFSSLKVRHLRTKLFLEIWPFHQKRGLRQQGQEIYFRCDLRNRRWRIHSSQIQWKCRTGLGIRLAQHDRTLVDRRMFDRCDSFYRNARTIHQIQSYLNKDGHLPACGAFLRAPAGRSPLESNMLRNWAYISTSAA
jgi:hypothetical protein